MDLLRVATVGHEFSTTNSENVKVPIYPGAGEIALLLSLRIWVHWVAADVWRHIQWILWRQSKIDFGATADPAAMSTLAADILSGGSFWHELSDANGGGASATIVDQQTFPEPGLPLIRQPQLALQSDQNVQPQVGAHFYYKLKKIDDALMAKLMVKDKGRV